MGTIILITFSLETFVIDTKVLCIKNLHLSLKCFFLTMYHLLMFLVLTISNTDYMYISIETLTIKK